MARNIRKVDLHIHTLVNPYLDSTFTFDMNTMIDYVSKNAFDAIAITNHNRFDKMQFLQIMNECMKLGCTCLPGIEISLDKGHILVIGDPEDDCYAVLQALSDDAQSNENDDHYSMTLDTFNSLVTDKRFLLIPHYYNKSPTISENTIKLIKVGIDAGEAGNQKKFFLAKRTDGPTPVCFSDIRIKQGLSEAEIMNYDKLTYINLSGVINVSSLRRALLDKQNVAIGKSFLEETFDILNGSVEASGGINVLIGERSSGKTHTLDCIYDSLGGAKSQDVLYIKQFEIQKNVGDIQAALVAKAMEAGKEFCKEFQAVIEYLDRINIGDKEGRVASYLDSLKKHAESSKMDEYSKASLYSYTPDEVVYGPSKVGEMRKNIEAILDADGNLLEMVKKYIEINGLISLRVELLTMEKKEHLQKKIVSIASEIAKNVSDQLSVKSVSIPIEHFDFTALLQARYARKCFDKLAGNIRRQSIADDTIFDRFHRTINAGPIPPKREFKTSLGLGQTAVPECLYTGSKTDAYLYISSNPLSQNTAGEFRWRCFVGVNCQVLNSHGANLSGGQSAEYCLLDKLYNHRKYQYVLIDELEPSFDNPFLHGHIISLLHDISKTATVFISTHNNNLGVSLVPDQYLYHVVEDCDTGTKYRIFFGPSTGSTLIDYESNSLSLSSVLMSTMEAGEQAYEKRRQCYENHEN